MGIGGSANTLTFKSVRERHVEKISKLCILSYGWSEDLSIQPRKELLRDGRDCRVLVLQLLVAKVN